MEVFYNLQRSNYEEIVSYSPKFYPKIKEMDAIYRFAGWTLDCAAKDMEKCFALQFTSNLHLDKEALERAEKFLKLKIDESKSINDRAKLVLAAWNTQGNISAERISELIYALISPDVGVEISFDDILRINIDTISSDASGQKELQEFLERMLPAHIQWQVIYSAPVEGQIYASAAILQADILNIKQGG